jgi:integrase
MQHKITVSNSTGSSTSSTGQTHIGQSAARFEKVKDGNKQPIRGLWKRGERFYAQLRIENPISGVKKTKRIPLVDADGQPVGTVAQAKAQMARLQTQRTDNALPVLDRQPKLAAYAKTYTDNASAGQGAKKKSTIEKETAILARWVDTIGGLRLDQIKRVHVNRFIDARLRDGAAPRTINLDVIALRVLLKRALADGLIQRLPTEGLRPLKVNTPKRALFSASDLEKLCVAALATKENGEPVTKNGQQLSDYLRFMAFSGCRRNEALGVKWEDVDFDNAQLHLRRQVTTKGIESLKNREMRVVDFNPRLRAHLLDMQERGKGVSDWLFPSPQRGDKDIPAHSFRESLELAKAKAKLDVGCHDCRHHFISMAVMSGVDFMTIAAWVGHKDGGVLIGKVYGHLANEHRKAMADKMNFGPAVFAATS